MVERKEICPGRELCVLVHELIDEREVYGVVLAPPGMPTADVWNVIYECEQKYAMKNRFFWDREKVLEELQSRGYTILHYS